MEIVLDFDRSFRGNGFKLMVLLSFSEHLNSTEVAAANSTSGLRRLFSWWRSRK